MIAGSRPAINVSALVTFRTMMEPITATIPIMMIPKTRPILSTHLGRHHRAAANQCSSTGSPSQASPATPFFITISEISALPHKIAMCDDGQRR